MPRSHPAAPGSLRLLGCAKWGCCLSKGQQQLLGLGIPKVFLDWRQPDTEALCEGFTSPVLLVDLQLGIHHGSNSVVDSSLETPPEPRASAQDTECSTLSHFKSQFIKRDQNLHGFHRSLLHSWFAPDCMAGIAILLLLLFFLLLLLFPGAVCSSPRPGDGAQSHQESRVKEAQTSHLQAAKEARYREQT